MRFKVMYSIKFLRIALGVFFLILGFYGISQNINEGIFGLNNPSHRDNQTIEMIFGIVELLCGVLLLSGLFTVKSSSLIYIGGLTVFVFWIARIVFTSFIWGIYISNQAVSFSPNLHQWILTLSTNLIIATALLVIINRYE